MDRSRYRIWKIPKANGGSREIWEPDPDLKTRQRAILKWMIQRRLRPSSAAHGFIRRRSVVSNARLHLGHKTVVRFDIQEFFPSISPVMVFLALTKNRVPIPLAEQLVEICTVEDHLPQGAPTSPFLSNLVFRQADARLQGLARSWEAVYSRYADDLIFSGNRGDLNRIYHPVSKILAEEGFQINRSKFRVFRSSRRQAITGIVVNEELNLPRELRRNLRAEIHQAKLRAGNGRGISMEQKRSLEGKVSWLGQVNPGAGRRVRNEMRDLLEAEGRK